jgi:SNF2 family DNA or RNA helicase
LFAECDFVPAIHSQAEKRLIRISQKNHVMCTYIVAQNTIEEHVADILQRKQGEFNSVMDGGKANDDFNLMRELLLRMNRDKLSRLK